ncbi:probable rhamnogalacturonase A precursor [Fusarium mangiferae]|uniref:Probable rhamnogalacturonase A n=1 Tax=Fusarium mangiferae TaxID=192010 RepID=A0A1L7UDC8_FUSMA|nr:putative rhamnogalacturonase A precursor [Fusarium mangiferae]CVL08698.1 probable rhamnogalacturonase A precursor [Fusarium mangiferae]
MRHSFISALIAVGSAVQAAAQLNGKVGPLTTASAKAAIKTCNIVDYGAKANAKTDNGPAIQKAWNDCRTGGGEPMSFRLDGIIYRIGTDGGNMFMFKHLEDFEFYSSTSKGAIQGYGYEFHKKNEYGPRILRFADVKSFSIHDVALVDSPAFHFSIDTCSDGEVYNMAIHGGNRGGLDGIDVWGTNIHIHDVEVSNKDECVTVKNPSDHLLIENIFCNWSGGCAMGSLATDTDIHDIEYKNIYTQRSNQMYMFKSYGGSGTVNNVALKNFAGHSNAYTLDLDAQWSSMKPIAGDGILYTNMTFSGWSGTCADGHQRGPIKFNCPADVPCTDMQVDDFAVGSNKGDTVEHVCKNAYGSGACLKEGDGGAYTTTQTVDAASAATPTMDGEIENGLGLTVSIAIPTIRPSFFPGVAAISPRMADGAKAQATARVETSVPDEAETAANTSAVVDVTVPVSTVASLATSATADEVTSLAIPTALSSLIPEEHSSVDTDVKTSTTSKAIETTAPLSKSPSCKAKRRQSL